MHRSCRLLELLWALVCLMYEGRMELWIRLPFTTKALETVLRASQSSTSKHPNIQAPLRHVSVNLSLHATYLQHSMHSTYARRNAIGSSAGVAVSSVPIKQRPAQGPQLEVEVPGNDTGSIIAWEVSEKKRRLGKNTKECKKEKNGRLTAVKCGRSG